MLAYFGDQPQPVRRLGRSMADERTGESGILLQSPLLAWSRKEDIRPVAPTKGTLLDFDSAFTFRSTYQNEFHGSRGPAAAAPGEGPVVAGRTSRETNVTRTRRCHTMAPRDSLANQTMDVVTARKPLDQKSIAVHGGYLGADGSWKQCSNRRRNEDAFAVVYKRNERELKEVMQPGENEAVVRETNETAYQRLRQGQRHKLAPEMEGKLYLFSEPRPIPFKPAKKMPMRSATPPARVGPEHRLLDYDENLPLTPGRAGRRPLLPPGQQTPQAEPAHQWPRKGHTPSQFQDHPDMLSWRTPEKRKQAPPAPPPDFLTEREKATLRHLERLQGADNGAEVATRIATLQETNQRRASGDPGALQGAMPDAPLAAGPAHDGDSDVLRGRRMGYRASCQNDSDPIVGRRPLSAVEEAHTPRRSGLKSAGYEYLSHHIDHDPLVQRPVYHGVGSGQVRTRRAKSAM